MLITVMLILMCILLLSSFVPLLVAGLVTFTAFRCCSAEGDNVVVVVYVVIVVCYSPCSRLCHLGLARWKITIIVFVVAAVVDLAFH